MNLVIVCHRAKKAIEPYLMNAPHVPPAVRYAYGERNKDFMKLREKERKRAEQDIKRRLPKLGVKVIEQPLTPQYQSQYEGK